MLKYEKTTARVIGKIRDLHGGKPIVIDSIDVYNIRTQYADAPEKLEQVIEKLQLAIYILCGGGMLASFAQCQPGQFYIDGRVGKLPGTRAQIYNAVALLCLNATAAGYDINGFDHTKKCLHEVSLPYAGWILEG
jgi:hypothetical protein